MMLEYYFLEINFIEKITSISQKMLKRATEQKNYISFSCSGWIYKKMLQYCVGIRFEIRQKSFCCRMDVFASLFPPD
jgi:cysteinyl-tRNA synthetase